MLKLQDVELLYLQAGLAVFLLPVNRDSLAARSSMSLLVSSSVTVGTESSCFMTFLLQMFLSRSDGQTQIHHLHL